MPTRFAQTASEPGAAGAPAPDAPLPPAVIVPVAGAGPVEVMEPSVATAPAPVGCPATLAERLTTTTLELDTNIRYKASGHEDIPMDERIALSVAPSGRAYVGWIEERSGRARVSPLDADLQRSGPDVLIDGLGIGGLIAHEDGFALLTRRADPGEPLSIWGDSSDTRAAFLVRYRGVDEVFGVPLTGTRSITRSVEPAARDCTVGYLYGRLGWNGQKYGAYFQVQGCDGDPHGQSAGDKMVYADAAGSFTQGGWSWSCGDNQGLRLLPERDEFTSVCFSASRRFAGLSLVTGGEAVLQLGRERIEGGYVTGQFGSLVKLGDGSYMVGWQSRGVGDAVSGIEIKEATDIAMIRLGPDREPLAEKQWLLETPFIAETNLHFAPYGEEHVLVIWDTMNDPTCKFAMCFGDYAGTYAGVIDSKGEFAVGPQLIPAVPNSGEDLIVFPNGDLGWAYVAESERDLSEPLPRNPSGLLVVPPARQVTVARLRYCN